MTKLPVTLTPEKTKSENDASLTTQNKMPSTRSLSKRDDHDGMSAMMHSAMGAGTG